jgi:pyruvate-formate lyase
VTCVLAGTDEAGKHMVTKTAFRMLNTLYNLGPAPEPNLTVLWNANLPENFKKFCAKVIRLWLVYLGSGPACSHSHGVAVWRLASLQRYRAGCLVCC